MLGKIDKNLWVAEQPLKYFGFNVGTRMTVIRFSTGEVAVISPIEVDEATVREINEIGYVKYLIAPNLFHYLFLEKFKAVYPKAKLYAPSALSSKLPNLSIDFPLEHRQDYFGNELEYLFFAGVNTLLPTGTSPLNEYVFFHRESQALILTDIAFYIDESFSSAIQLAARVVGGYKQLRPSFLEQFATSDKEQVRRSAQRLLQWDFQRAIVAHGSIIERGAKQQFQDGYEWFLGRSL